MTNDNKGEILIYQTQDGANRLDVRLDGETVWLTQDQMTELFQRDKSVISRHIKNIFEDGELDEKSVVAFFATTASDGKNYNVAYYNLDVIISVGYRVKSKRGVQFRQWATQQAADNFSKQYGDLEMHAVKSIHDRFLIIDNKEIYLIGASLKDLGRKLFAFSKMEPQQIGLLKQYLKTI